MICKTCGKNIENSNFCPNCGMPISDIALKIEKAKQDTTKLKLISEIVNNTTDEKTLDFLKKLANKISSK